MTRLHRNRNWKIDVCGLEHGIPHFHLLWPGGRASISIETLEVIIGRPPANILAKAREWAASNKELLLVTWNLLNPSRSKPQ